MGGFLLSRCLTSDHDISGAKVARLTSTASDRAINRLRVRVPPSKLFVFELLLPCFFLLNIYFVIKTMNEGSSPIAQSSDCEYFALENDEGMTRVESGILSPVPFRDEAGFRNEESVRLVFDEDNTLPSREAFPRSPFLARREPAELNGLNYLNVVTYAAHLFVSWGIGVWGLHGILRTRWELSLQYETLVMPAHWAYYLWGPILILEGIFALAQLFPYYRARPIIQAGSGYFFFYTFLLQTAWTFFFCFQLFICSFVAVTLTLLSLLGLLASQQKHRVPSGRSSRVEYALFRFPFYLHTGWMVLMAVDHFALLFRKLNASLGLQVAADIFSLGILMAVAAAYLVRPYKAGWVIPAVILWSYLGIAWRLHTPSDVMMALYGDTIVSAVRYSVFFFAGAVSCCLVPNTVVWAAHEFLTINVIELD